MLQESKRLNDWLKGELNDPKDYCREAVTILAGETLKTGQVLGKITASGKYVEFDPAVTDGSGTAAAILITKSVDGSTSVDNDAVALVRGPAVVNPNGITWITGISTNNKNTAIAALEALGIQFKEGA